MFILSFELDILGEFSSFKILLILEYIYFLMVFYIQNIEEEISFKCFNLYFSLQLLKRISLQFNCIEKCRIFFYWNYTLSWFNGLILIQFLLTIAINEKFNFNDISTMKITILFFCHSLVFLCSYMYFLYYILHNILWIQHICCFHDRTKIIEP